MKYFLTYAILIVLLNACSETKKNSSAVEKEPETHTILLTKEQMDKAGIVTGQIIKEPIHSAIAVNGVVDVPPQNLISVSFPLGGYLKYTKLMPGMPVHRGEVIAEMEDPSIVQLQQDYLMANARMSFLTKELTRQTSLNVDKTSSDKALEQISSDHESQQVLLYALAEKLRMIGIEPESLKPGMITRKAQIRSPIHGYVSKVNVNTGKYIQPTDVLFELINPDDIHAALSIFEKDLSKVSVGQKVSISFVDEPMVEYDAEIILLNHNVDEDRTAVAHCHFHTKPRKLLPGMFLNAKIHHEHASVPVLPESALVRYQNQDFVFVESSPLQFTMIPVKTGIKNSQKVEIGEGYDAIGGRNVVVKGAYSILGAMKNTSDE